MKYIPLFLCFLAWIMGCSKDSINPIAENLPIIETAEITDIGQITALCGGTISSDEGSYVFTRGICWSTNSVPTIEDDTIIVGSGAGTFNGKIFGFPDSTYNIRAYATNEYGTSYGSTMTIKMEPYGNVTDIENNYYKTLILGDQEWMVENLKVTHYNNNDVIPLIIDNNSWLSESSGAYCNLNDDPTYGQLNGRIYNRYVTIDDRNICPSGWHIPAQDDIHNLKTVVGVDLIGRINFFIKAGGRQPTTSGYFLNSSALWTSTEELDYSYIFGTQLLVESTGGNWHGFGIRCIKD